MNLKTKLIITVVLVVIGFALRACLVKPEPEVVPIKVDSHTIVKKKVIKRHDGTVEVDTVTTNSTKVESKPSKPRDNVLLQASSNLAVGAMISPVEHIWIGVEHNLRSHETTYKVGYSTRIF
jgi:hypothetical protein